MPNILSESQKQRIKNEFYDTWKTCQNEMVFQGKMNTITSSRQPTIFALREVMRSTGVLAEIEHKFDGRIDTILEELKLCCRSCGKRLNGYAEVGKYLGDDEFWHSFNNNNVTEKKQIPVRRNIKQSRPKNTRIQNARKSAASTNNNNDRPKSKQLLIVCVDDSIQTLKVMEQIVTKQGYKFIGVRDTLQVLPTMVSNEPDLIFSDIEMPVFNGYEICHQIRNVPKLKNKPIVMLTSNTKPLSRLKAKMAGATDFLAKPIDVNQIVATMEKYLPVEKTFLSYPEHETIAPQLI
ncbi:MAG: response regulator [Prochloraceae cyanobacterium]|nr:response regulator [Prochloraceae cyanobacterium]